MSLTFSEAMDAGSLQVTTTPVMDFAAPVWSSETSVVLNPLADWPVGATVQVLVSAADEAGNKLTGGASFTFQVSVDDTPPAAPTGLALVPLDAGFFARWETNPEADVARYAVRWSAAGSSVDGLGVPAPATELTVTGLTNGQAYDVFVVAEDFAGNESAPSTSVAVTPVNGLGPTLLSSSPENGSAALGAVDLVRLTFSEPLQQSTFVVVTCIIAEMGVGSPCATTLPSQVLGAPVWSSGGTVAVFDTAGVFASETNYRLSLAGADMDGNLLKADTYIEFGVSILPDVEAPTLIDISFGENVAEHTLTTLLTFSEPMDEASVAAAFLSQPPLTCRELIQGGPASYACISTAGVTQLTEYTITIGTNATDLAGNHLASARQAQHTTLDFYPRLAQVSPATGGLAPVPPTVPLVFTFSEPIEPASLRGEVRTGSGTLIGVLDGNVTPDPTRPEVLTFEPVGQFPPGATVVWTITSALDLATPTPYALLEPVSGSFLVRAVVGSGDVVGGGEGVR